ncbi:Uncharacterised protein [Mycobacteroides abscessus subsp. abscessus]|nr:Uncharacterised protein [Mycobacteroides abscessus subsp. abscessus]
MQRLAGDVGAHMLAEQFAQLTPLLADLHHPVEARLQYAELAAVIDLDARVEVALCHIADGGAQLAHRVGELPGGQ